MLFNAKAETLSANAWAEQAHAVLGTISGGWRDPAQESQIGYELLALLFHKAANERHTGRLDSAQKTADRMLAFASKIVARCSGQPAHLGLSLAFAQYYKNASREDDRRAVTTNLRMALASAQNALLLNVKNDWSRRAVTQLEEKLKGWHEGR